MGAHPHPHPHSRPRRPWGESAPGWAARLLDRLRSLSGSAGPHGGEGLRELPLALRRGELATAYLDAERARDHRAAGAAASAAGERAIAAGEWWQADLWGHRALWHFEQAEMALEATRQARRIGDLRVAAGDPDSARRYYAEAIGEARDLGAEHEQGLAAFGLGRALLELGEVTQARRMAAASVELLDRAGAPVGELEAAQELLGSEVRVGEEMEDA